MFEINAELINDKVYFCAEDMIKICEASISGKGSPFDFALKSLAGQLRNMELEAKQDIGEKNENDVPATA